MVCRKVCNATVEYRRSYSDTFCTPKAPPGAPCYSPQSCRSGVCRGSMGSSYSGYCCSPAAANCTKGCEPITGACTNKSSVGEACQSDAGCYGGRACLNSTCCGFSTSDGYYRNSLVNCSACSVTGVCQACNPGYNLEPEYFSGPPTTSMTCRKVCNATVEYRRDAHDTFCVPKEHPGTTCYAPQSCKSGVCRGLMGSKTSGYCCSPAAANCTKGCDPMTGACTNKSNIGEACQSDAGCYGDRACLNSTCCRFSTYEVNPSNKYYYYTDTSGYSNCAACSTPGDTNKNTSAGTCSACKPGHRLEKYYVSGGSYPGPIVIDVNRMAGRARSLALRLFAQRDSSFIIINTRSEIGTARCGAV